MAIATTATTLCPSLHPPQFPSSLPQSTVKFDRYGFSTAGCRHKRLNLAAPDANSSHSRGFRAKASSSEPMVPPYNVLITGSTKGIGYALAKEFLEEGDNVIICSRSAERVDFAIQSLRVEFGKQHVVPNVMFEMGTM